MGRFSTLQITPEEPKTGGRFAHLVKPQPDIITGGDIGLMSPEEENRPRLGVKKAFSRNDIPVLRNIPTLAEWKAVIANPNNPLNPNYKGREEYKGKQGQGFIEARDRFVYAVRKVARILPKIQSLMGVDTAEEDYPEKYKARRVLMEDMPKEFTGVGGITVPVTQEVAQLAVEWTYLYPRLFKMAGMGNEAIASIPAVKKAGQIIEKSGGIKAIAEKFPRAYQATKNAISAGVKGFEVGAGVQTVSGADEGTPIGQRVKDIAKAGGKMATVTSVLSAAGSVDAQIKIKSVKKAMLRKLDADLQKLTAQIPVGQGSAAQIQALGQTYRDNALRYIDKAIAGFESEITGFRKSNLYPNVANAKLAKSTPAKVIDRFLKYGYEPGREIGFNAPEPLITGMGVRKTGDILAGEPTTRTGEIVKAITRPVETVKEAIKDIRGNIKPQSAAELQKIPAAPINNTGKNELRKLGYTISEILEMDSAEAADILSQEAPSEPLVVAAVAERPVEGVKVPAETEKGITVYRGNMAEGRQGNFYSTDKEFARNFTQSGQDKEISQTIIPESKIYKSEILPFAGDVKSMNTAISEANKNGFGAIWVNEGERQPNSIFVIDKSLIQASSEAVTEVKSKGVKVSPAGGQEAGELTTATPEGKKYLVDLAQEKLKQVGAVIYQVHRAGKDFESTYIDFQFPNQQFQTLRVSDHTSGRMAKFQAGDIRSESELNNFISQVKPSPVPAKPAEKQAWEMTSDSYAKLQTAKMKEKMGDKYINVEDGETTAKQWHKKYVQDALSEGKTVPAEVLAEYPELKAEAKLPPPEGGKKQTLEQGRKQALQSIREQAQKPISEQERNPQLKIISEKDLAGQRKIKEGETGDFHADPTIDIDPTGKGGFVIAPGGRGERGKAQKNWLNIDKVKSPDEDIEDFFGRTHRPPYSKKASSLVDKAVAYYRERFILTFHTPQTPETAYIRDLIRTMPEERRYAGEKAIKDIIAILDGDGTVQALDSAGLDLLRRKVFVQDILHEAEISRSVSGNLEIEKLQAEDKRLDELINQVPSVKKAYEARQKLWEDVSKDLLERGVLGEEEAQNRAYVRHFVLDLAEKNGPTGFKRKRLSDPYRAYSKHRKGSVKDISTDYLSVEVKALGEIYADNAVEDVANKIGKKENKRKAYTVAAKAVNFRNLVGGQENVNRIMQLRSFIKGSQEDPDTQESDMKLQRKQWIEELTKLDPTYLYRKRIAMHMSKIRKGSTYSELEDDTSSLFKELARFAKEEAKSPLGLAARGVFKAMAERDRMIRDALGKEYMAPEKLALKDDYVEWFYKRPNIFYRAATLAESQIAAFVESSAEEVGDMLHIPKSKLRSALVMGRRKGMLIPSWLAAQLDDLPVNKRSGYISSSFAKPFIQFWKRWILRVNPIRYNSRNQLGDTERLNASGQTSRIKNVPQALKLLITKEGELYTLAKRYGVINSSLWHEMNDVSKLKEFERFKNISYQKNFKQVMASLFTLPLRTVARVGSVEQTLTQMREDVLRLAVFVGNYEDLKAGKSVRHWAGSVADIEAIAKEEPAMAAAKISRETLGDYGAFTQFENDKLRQGWIPFYSWMKINGTFWPRVLINAAKEGKGGAVTKIITGKIGLNIAKWLVRVLWAYAAAYLWNHRDGKAVEKEEALPFWMRAMPHVNIGDVTIWGQTALSDFMEWFGMEELAGVMWRKDAGFLDTKEAALEAAKVIAEAPVNKVYQALNPYLKAPITAITGQTTYPNVFEPHFVAKPASVNSLERAILDIMGGDAKKFYQSAVADKKGNRRALDDTLYAYFAGWFMRQTDEDTLIEEIQRTKQWTTLKNKSKTTGRVKGEAKKGKESEWQEAKIRERAIR